MRKGEKMTEEMRKRLSLIKMGRPSPLKGKKLSESHKKKISQARMGKPSNFKGKTPSIEAREKLSLARKQYLLRMDKDYDVTGKSLADNRKRVRRERIRRFGGFHSLGEWENLKAQCNWTCPSCQRSEPEIKLTKDHIIPISRGGSDNIENIQPLCNPCNARKSIRTIKYE